MSLPPVPPAKQRRGAADGPPALPPAWAPAAAGGLGRRPWARAGDEALPRPLCSRPPFLEQKLRGGGRCWLWSLPRRQGLGTGLAGVRGTRRPRGRGWGACSRRREVAGASPVLSGWNAARPGHGCAPWPRVPGAPEQSERARAPSSPPPSPRPGWRDRRDSNWSVPDDSVHTAEAEVPSVTKFSGRSRNTQPLKRQRYWGENPWGEVYPQHLRRGAVQGWARLGATGHGRFRNRLVLCSCSVSPVG